VTPASAAGAAANRTDVECSPIGEYADVEAFCKSFGGRVCKLNEVRIANSSPPLQVPTLIR
jgi:hypothetical protein